MPSLILERPRVSEELKRANVQTEFKYALSHFRVNFSKTTQCTNIKLGTSDHLVGMNVMRWLVTS